MSLIPRRRSLLAAAAAALTLPLACATPASAQQDQQDQPERPSTEGERPRGERGERPRRGERGDGEGRPDRGDRPDGEGRGDREGRGGRFGQGGERRGPGGGAEGMSRFLQSIPVLAALDADGDGTLSESEINNATAALKTVDKNKDKKIDAEEMRPNFAGMGGPGRPGMDRDGDRGDRPDGDRPERNMNPDQMAEGFLRRDADGDGVLSGDEIPERMQRGMERIDTNKDKKIDRAELKNMFETMRDRGPRGEGDRSRGDRPEGDRSRGDRPERDRPEADAPEADGDPV